jgi:hypothetical protein
LLIQAPVFQTIGAAFIVSAGQSVFTNTLIKRLSSTAPSIDPAQVVATGAAGLRDKFSADVLPGLLWAYMDGLRIVFAVTIASAGIATLVSMFIEKGSLTTAKKARPATLEC